MYAPGFKRSTARAKFPPPLYRVGCRCCEARQSKRYEEGEVAHQGQIDENLYANPIEKISLIWNLCQLESATRGVRES